MNKNLLKDKLTLQKIILLQLHLNPNIKNHPINFNKIKANKNRFAIIKNNIINLQIKKINILTRDLAIKNAKLIIINKNFINDNNNITNITQKKFWKPGLLTNKIYNKVPSLIIFFKNNLDNDINLNFFKNEIIKLQIPSIMIIDLKTNPINYYFSTILNIFNPYQQKFLINIIKYSTIEGNIIRILKFKKKL